MYDDKNKVCVQITSNNRQEKRRSTIKSFQEKYLGNRFNTLIIIFIANSKPKEKVNIDFDYSDYDIIEFATFIETQCFPTELLKIRDILLTNLDLQPNIPAKQNLNRKTSINATKKEFLRCKKLEKELKKELLRNGDWEIADKEVVAKDPTHQFKDSRFILRSIEDESYPNLDKNSKWSRSFMYDFYDRGILIWIDTVSDGSEVIINEKQEWYLEKYEDGNIPLPENSTKIKIRTLGKLPFKNIVYLQNGDGYYGYYHLFCKFVGVNNDPFDEIVYRYKNSMGYYWEDLDASKRIT